MTQPAAPGPTASKEIAASDPQSTPPAIDPPKQRDRGAALLAQFVIPGALADLVGLNDIPLLAAKDYLEGVRREAGNPSDPVERMLIEQLALAHFRLGKLQVQATEATSPQHIRVLNAAAARLLGEFRRLALAIRAYRQPAGQKSFSVVHQQNVVSTGQQLVQLNASPAKETLRVRGELEGSPVERRIHGESRVGEEPPPSGLGSHQRAEAAALDT